MPGAFSAASEALKDEMALQAISDATSPLLTAEEMQAADAFTIETLGVPGIVLMEHAGKAVAEFALRRTKKRRKAVVICGPGNNGGDGFVTARHMAGAGCDVTVVATREIDALQGDAKTAANAWMRAVEHTDTARCETIFALESVNNDENTHLIEALATELASADVAIDALFGIGLGRQIEGSLAKLVEVMNAAPCPIVAVDLPSGLPTRGAKPKGAFVNAAETVTFFAKKLAHVAEETQQACGTVHVVDVSIRAPKGTRVTRRVLKRSARLAIVRDEKSAVHKGTFGHVGVVSGTRKTLGASRLAALAALRAGAGYCSLLERPGALGHPADRVEMMRVEVDLEQETDASDVLGRLDAFVAGPGLGTTDDDIRRGLRVLSLREHRPAVVDADLLAGIFASTKQTNAVFECGAGALVMTPHPGEAARILRQNANQDDQEWTAARVQADRLAAIDALCALRDDERAVFVLKGAVPIVGWKDWRIFVPGNHAVLAVAGSGDVLAGAIAAHLALSDGPEEAFAAAVEGVRQHQAAGARLGARGALASEIADALRPRGTTP